jgi:hypothetical protein
MALLGHVVNNMLAPQVIAPAIHGGIRDSNDKKATDGVLLIAACYPAYSPPHLPRMLH